MKRLKRQDGFTLMEAGLAMMLAGGFFLALFIFYIPSVNVYASVMGNADQKSSLTDVMMSISQDASTMGAIYVPTGGQCFALCMVDQSVGQRTYYYWDPAATGNTKTLYRKTEATTNTIACSGGKVFARNLDSANTSFTMNKSLLSVQLSGLGEVGTKYANSAFKLSSSIFPVVQERQMIFSEGFECGMLRPEWVVTPVTGNTWTINNTAHLGRYQIADNAPNGTSTTTSIQVSLDLSRTSAAHLKFNYMNDGTISPTDNFSASISWDGGTNWTPVFSDTSGQSVLTAKTIEADLSGYTLNNQNQIKFTGTLKNNGSHWYVDSIQVFTP